MLVWPNQISAWDSHKDSDMLITSRVVLLEKKSASVDVFCSSLANCTSCVVYLKTKDSMFVVHVEEATFQCFSRENVSSFMPVKLQYAVFWC